MAKDAAKESKSSASIIKRRWQEVDLGTFQCLFKT